MVFGEICGELIDPTQQKQHLKAINRGLDAIAGISCLRHGFNLDHPTERTACAAFMMPSMITKIAFTASLAVSNASSAAFRRSVVAPIRTAYPATARHAAARLMTRLPHPLGSNQIVLEGHCEQAFDEIGA